MTVSPTYEPALERPPGTPKRYTTFQTRRTELVRRLPLGPRRPFLGAPVGHVELPLRPAEREDGLHVAAADRRRQVRILHAVRAGDDALVPGRHHVLRAAADVERRRLADDGDDEPRGRHVLGRVHRFGERRLVRHEDELPLLRVPRAAGDAPGVEDPLDDDAVDRPLGVPPLVPLARDREQRLHQLRRKDGTSTSPPSSATTGRENVRVLGRCRPMPVATTVTHTWPVSRSSTVAPKMMFVSSVAAERIASAASLTSISVMSSPPATESRMPVAPVISSSMSGERSARSAASFARPSVADEKPMPMSAVPELLMIVRTSAKSRLMSPGSVMRSVMPCTPWRRTSSATLNASSIDVDLSSTSSSRSFGMTIVVSHAARSAATP